jgi:methylmalonyl-CoA/ethylmalonyl-CoA epimerase
MLTMPGVVASSAVLGRIDHIGVAIEDLDEAIALYRDRLGFELEHRETMESQGIEAILLGVGENHVELMRPLGPDTTVGRFLARNGPGLHHVAYGTDDIEQALESVRAAGLQLIDEKPRRGVRGKRVAFLHPKSTGGVLTELVEAPEAH